MPKLRTKTAFKKRFKVSKTGKVLFTSVGDAKLHSKKSRKTKRRYGKADEMVLKKDASKIRTALSK